MFDDRDKWSTKLSRYLNVVIDRLKVADVVAQGRGLTDQKRKAWSASGGDQPLTALGPWRTRRCAWSIAPAFHSGARSSRRLNGVALNFVDTNPREVSHRVTTYRSEW